MSRALQLLESYRGAYQVMVTPTKDSVIVRFQDDHIGNDHLRFPPVTLSHTKFFEVIPHNENTQATFDLALERGDTYGIFVNPYTVSRLARKGQPGGDLEFAPRQFAHTHSRQEPSELSPSRHAMMTGRV